MHEDAGKRDEDSRQANASSGTKGRPPQEEESGGSGREELKTEEGLGELKGKLPALLPAQLSGRRDCTLSII